MTKRKLVSVLRFPTAFIFRRSANLAAKVILLSLLILLAVTIKSNECENGFPVDRVRENEDDISAGDCQAIGRRRPPWDDRARMVSRLPEFASIYKHRPFSENSGGMRFHHSFGLWYVLQVIRPKPTAVIESGANRGHTTWIIRQALPGVKIMTISPNTPPHRENNTVYMTGANFKDFNQINWSVSNIDPSTALILFDDHQSAYRRIFKEAIPLGFNRIINDDNCAYQQCDALSMKWLCEVGRKREWMGYVRDNFGKITEKQTWDEHLAQVEELDRVRFYYEFPPVIGARGGIEPLVTDTRTLGYLVGDVAKNESEFRSYAFMGYVEF